MNAEKWDGVPGAAEHRTTGGRAWCYLDTEWCYPNIPCPCCMEASDDYEVCSTCNGEGYVRKAGESL